jgi:alcohol dehydrogenase class IV
MIIRDFTFHIPTKIVFGRGKIKTIEECLDPGAQNVLIVTDKNVVEKSGALDKLRNGLRACQRFVFDEVEENPSFEQVSRGARFAVENNVDLVIGVGGGSPMDAAKGIAVLARNNGDLKEYTAGRPFEKSPLPIVCIPTTSGTGSEVTPFAVFTDPEDEQKVGYANPGLFPQLAIVDPELTYSMPEKVLVNTGFDALIHSIEAYLSTESFPLNDQLALHSIEVAVANLKRARAKDEEAMDAMAYSATIAGIAIANAGTILLHIMAYPLTVFHHIPHGLANAILLPEFIRFMKEKSSVKEKVGKIEELFDRVGGIEKFINDGFSISTRLRDYGISENELPEFAAKTIKKSDIGITPAAVTEADIIELYKKAL